MRLIVENVTCQRGGRILFRDLSFSVAEGEGMLLEGQNGAGKTSLIRIIAGFLPPNSGHIIFEGITEEMESVEKIHYVGHKNGLKSNLTVEETVEFWQTYLGENSTGQSHEFHNQDDHISLVPSIENAVNKFGLSSLMTIPAGLLSAGQKRRLSLSRLLLASRPLWLLDEPSHGLDAASQDILANLISTHISEGGSVIATTHTPLGVAFGKSLNLSGEGIAR